MKSFEPSLTPAQPPLLWRSDLTLVPVEELATGEDPRQSEATLAQHAKTVLNNYRNLVARAVEVFGDDIKAASWLSMPSPDFGGKPPIQAAQEVDYSEQELERLFEPVFVRIEEGIYW